jgi:hypothetical protein
MQHQGVPTKNSHKQMLILKIDQLNPHSLNLQPKEYLLGFKLGEIFVMYRLFFSLFF